MRKWSPVAAAAILSVVAAAGCGSSGTSASSYVHQVCRAASGFEVKVQGLETSFTNQSKSNVSNLAVLKKEFVTLLAKAETDTNQLKAQVAAAGTPAVSHGSEVRTSLLGAFTTLASDFAKAKHQAGAMSTSDPATFSSALEQIGGQINAEASTLGAQLGGKSGLGKGALNGAAQKDPACQALAKG